jgi:hypothetical protein
LTSKRRHIMPWTNIFGTQTCAGRVTVQRRKAARAGAILPTGSPVPMIRLVMTPCSARQALTLLLAVLVTLSMSLSLVQASTMSAMGDMTPTMSKMTMGGSGHDTCKNCTKGGDGAKAVACGSFCVTPAIATLPQNAFTARSRPSVTAIKLYSLLRGRVPAPDPYPPRPNDLG